MYIIYDGRAIYGDTDDASVLVACDSLEEARGYKGDFGDGCVIYSYDEKDELLINEKFEEIL